MNELDVPETRAAITEKVEAFANEHGLTLHWFDDAPDNGNCHRTGALYKHEWIREGEPDASGFFIRASVWAARWGYTGPNYEITLNLAPYVQYEGPDKLGNKDDDGEYLQSIQRLVDGKWVGDRMSSQPSIRLDDHHLGQRGIPDWWQWPVWFQAVVDTATSRIEHRRRLIQAMKAEQRWRAEFKTGADGNFTRGDIRCRLLRHDARLWVAIEANLDPVKARALLNHLSEMTA